MNCLFLDSIKASFFPHKTTCALSIVLKIGIIFFIFSADREFKVNNVSPFLAIPPFSAIIKISSFMGANL